MTSQHVFCAAGTGILVRRSLVRGSSAKGHWVWALTASDRFVANFLIWNDLLGAEGLCSVTVLSQDLAPFNGEGPQAVLF